MSHMITAQPPQVSDLEKSATDALAQAIAAIDFDNLRELLTIGEEVLRYVATPARLGALLDRTLRDPSLLAMCERFNLFEKVVLYDEPARKVRLRLHLFGGEVREIHHHRASFTSLVLHGSYTHTLFGDERYLEEPADGRLSLRALMMQEQRRGTAYALDHAMVHGTLAKPETVSLVLQAPTARPSFRIYDLETGRGRVRMGKEQAREVQEEGESGMTNERLREIITTLRQWGLA